MKKYFLLLGLLLVFSCKKAEEVPVGLNFYFENPQPINDSELKKFPSKFRGLYLDKDSSFLKIEENVILSESYFKFRIHKKELDSLKKDFVFSNGRLIEKSNDEMYEVVEKGDSLELSNKNTDTLFMFSNSQKAKRINGYLVLNTKDSIFWKVKLVSIEKEVLKIRYIYSEDDLKKIDSITRVKAKMIDSSSFIIKPTRREFKKILNLKQLGDERQFKKISK
jgi:hypothetical protein